MVKFNYLARTAMCVLTAAVLMAASAQAQPTIFATVPATGQTVPVTFTASFAVYVDSSTPFTCQWYFDGQRIAGATNNLLNIIDSQPTNAGTYTVIVTNSSGGVTSAPIALVVSNEPSQLTNTLFSTVASFTSNSTGAFSQNSLVQGPDGYLYGTTLLGGADDDGTVFKINTNGAFAWVFSFNDANGANPSAGLAVSPDGSLYGTTAAGGTFGNGAVFRISTNETFQPIYSFTGNADGADPESSLVLGTDGDFYGTAAAGGTNDVADGGDGTIFKIGTNGTVIWSYSFSPLNGLFPLSGLMLATNGNFYGTTSEGGTNNTVNGGDGAIFVISPSGAFTNIYSFTGGSDGSSPYAGLTQGNDGNFYGTAYAGGTNSQGTLFKITPLGVLNTLVTFNGTNGGAPEASLFLAADRNFYSTTSQGGIGYPATSYGTLFQMTSAGVLTTLVSFDGNYDGAFPHSTLVQGHDGGLYGTTSEGGTNDLATGGDGTIFRLGVLAPLIESVTRTGLTVSLTWNSMVGEPYQVQYTTNLVQPDWVDFGGPIYGTNGVGGASDTISATNAPRFYRVVLE
jgi:uncharacterized repeat protein (TIGR03803 family)